MTRPASKVVGIMAGLIFLIAGTAGGAAPDWEKIASTNLTLFYPGTTSWDFLSGEDHKLGGRDIKLRKKDCRHCHLSKEGELDLKAAEIAAGTIKMKRSHRPFEPEPMQGKKGVITARVQAAYDNEYLYLRVRWDSNGAAWLSKDAGNSPPDRVSLQLNGGSVVFRKYGCFITCHNDLSSMPDSPSKKEVKENGYYGPLGRDDVRLYAEYARDTWKKPRDKGELKKLLLSDGLIDVLSIELRGAGARALDGWILEDRRWDDGNNGLEAEGSWDNGRYAVVFKRRLDLKDDLDLRIRPGAVLYAGVAIHDNGAEKRKHYVSFPFSIGLGADADVKAERLK